MGRVKQVVMAWGARLAMTRPVSALLARRVRKGEAKGLDRQIAAVLALEALLKYPAVESMTPVAAREHVSKGLSILDVPIAEMARIEDITVARLPVRLYVPKHAGPHWIVYLHGGGGVIGSIDSSDAATRYLAAKTGCTVASVEYRLGPEHKHPAAIDDSVAAFTELAGRASGKVAVAGDSFGGFLAAHVDYATRQAGTRAPDLQVLIYPIVDLTLTSPSIERHARGYLLTKALMHWFRDHYLNATDDQRASSPRYFASLKGSAPAIVATAGYDPLVDEGDGYAEALVKAGVTVRHRRYPGLIHGFLSLGGASRAARAAVDEVAADIRAML
jgi:acetyl esterase